MQVGDSGLEVINVRALWVNIQSLTSYSAAVKIGVNQIIVTLISKKSDQSTWKQNLFPRIE